MTLDLLVPTPRRWCGRSLMLIAAIHTAVAALEFGDVLHGMLMQGMVDSVGRDPLRGAVAWFVLFGVLLFVLGGALDMLEHRVPGFHSRFLAVCFSLLLALGIVLMPLSGFWLAVPVAVRLYRQTPVP